MAIEARCRAGRDGVIRTRGLGHVFVHTAKPGGKSLVQALQRSVMKDDTQSADATKAVTHRKRATALTGWG